MFEIDSPQVEGFLWDRGTARFDLAQALWGMEGDRRRALDEAREACSELGALPIGAAERTKVDAWVARHESESHR